MITDRKLEEIAAELRSGRQNQQDVPKNRQCPICGGALAGEFRKCPNCAEELVWVETTLGRLPSEPGREQQVIDWSTQEAERKEHEARARMVPCKRCRKMTDRISDGECSACAATHGCLTAVLAIAGGICCLWGLCLLI
jgi:hypothetical protein